MYSQLLKRELLIAFRHRHHYLTSVAFFIVVGALFPLGMEWDNTILPIMGSGVIWITAFLAILLYLPLMFYEDFQDGTLEQMCFSPASFVLLIALRLFVTWLFIFFPLALAFPFLGMAYEIPALPLEVMLLTLLLASPILLLLGALMAAITVGLRSNSLLLGLLVLPLYIPTLIFGHAATAAAFAHQPFLIDWIYLLILLVLSLLFAPWGIARALRISLE